MGQRQLIVHADMFAAFYTNHNSAERTYTVEDPLPDDVRFVDFLFKANGQMALILESDEWIGQSEIALEPPRVRVYFDCKPGESDSIPTRQRESILPDGNRLVEIEMGEMTPG